MKTKLILLSALAAINSTCATSINWEESASRIDILASGTGFSQESVVSPSGLWELELRSFAVFEPETTTPSIAMFPRGQLTFLPSGGFLSSGGPFIEFIHPGQIPIVSDRWASSPFAPPVDGWSGFLTFAITSIPSLEDNSTWSWQALYHFAGPGAAVPEGGSAWLLMAFASGILLCFRPKSA